MGPGPPLIQEARALDQTPALRLVEEGLLAGPALAPGSRHSAEVAAAVGATAREAAAPDLIAVADDLVKRTIDVLVACVLIVVLAPLFLLIALIVVLDSTGPVFYRATRVGLQGRRLQVLKFRKMHFDARGGPLTIAGDQRFTRIGRWLARTKLDELPQLLNVLRGDMSLIGPRPEDAAFVERHREAFDVILRVRPGMSGLSQLAYRAESEILDRRDPVADYEDRVLPQKLHLDRLYVSRASALLDLRILAWTVLTTFMAVPVSVDRCTAHIRPRLSYGGRRIAGGGWWASLPDRGRKPDADAAVASPSLEPTVDLYITKGAE